MDDNFFGWGDYAYNGFYANSNEEREEKYERWERNQPVCEWDCLNCSHFSLPARYCSVRNRKIDLTNKQWEQIRERNQRLV